MPNERSGTFSLDRHVLQQLTRDLGPTARLLYIELAANARTTAETFVTARGIRLDLQSGDAIFSARSYAERLGLSPSSAHRALQRLEDYGYVAVRRDTRRGSRTAPSTVKVFKHVNSAPQSQHQNVEPGTRNENEASTSKAFHLGSTSLSASTSAETSTPTNNEERQRSVPIRQSPGPRHSYFCEAENVRNEEQLVLFYKLCVGSPESEPEALLPIADLIRRGFSVRSLAEAVANYADVCLPYAFSPLSAVEFFSHKAMDFVTT